MRAKSPTSSTGCQRSRSTASSGESRPACTSRRTSISVSSFTMQQRLVHTAVPQPLKIQRNVHVTGGLYRLDNLFAPGEGRWKLRLLDLDPGQRVMVANAQVLKT